MFFKYVQFILVEQEVRKEKKKKEEEKEYTK